LKGGKEMYKKFKKVFALTLVLLMIFGGLPNSMFSAKRAYADPVATGGGTGSSGGASSEPTPTPGSSITTVTSKANHYIVNEGAKTIIANETSITTAVTVSDFLSNLQMHAAAEWKVVTTGTEIADATAFNGAIGKAVDSKMAVGDKLAVKAEDGTVKVYEITVTVVVTALTLDSLITAPVKRATSSIAAIDQTQYTGTVEWYGSDGTTAVTGNFAASTVYKAKVTLTAKSGYTLTGVAQNSFSYTGATSTTNAVNSGTVTITFPATGAASSNTDVTGEGEVTVNLTAGTITFIIEADQEVTVRDLSFALDKNEKANWKFTAATTADNTSFASISAKGNDDELTNGDKLFVEAEDGTVKVYTITVTSGNLEPQPQLPEGAGTEQRPYLISSVENLLWMQENIGANNGFSGMYFRQTVDIDLSGISNWIPIGTGSGSSIFYGIYDGYGHTISNIKINNDDINVPTIGLFGSVGGFDGSIKNLGVVNVNIKTTVGSVVGAIVGNLSYGKISNCYSTGTIEAAGTVGGLVGAVAAYAKITNSYSTCIVRGQSVGQTSNNIGGLVGFNMANVLDCFYAGSEVTNAKGSSVGTLAGANYRSIDYSYAATIGALKKVGDGNPVTHTNSSALIASFFTDPNNFNGYSSASSWDLTTIWSLPNDGVTFPQLIPQGIASDSTDATLSDISITTGSLNPAFASVTIGYTAIVTNETSSITITPTVNEGHATVTVNGTTVASGQASGAISLNVGSNTITVVATAQDGTTLKTYTIAVTREATVWTDITGSQVLDYPYGIAIDSAQNVYITEKFADYAGLGKIWKISPNGTWTDLTGVEDLNAPTGIVVDVNGNVYITDRNNNKIKKRATDGTWTDLTGAESFNGPNGIAIDGSGNLYVVERGANKVRKYNANEGTWSDLTKGESFSSPTGIAVDSNGIVYVADNDNSIIKRLQNNTWTTIDGLNLNYAYGVAVDGNNDLYITDTYNKQIKKYSVQNATMTDITAGEIFNLPYSIVVGSDYMVYVVDRADAKVKKRLPVASSDTNVSSNLDYVIADLNAETITVISPDGDAIVQDLKFGLSKNSAASWKFTGANVDNGISFSELTEKDNGDMLVTGDKLFVEAGDGTIKVYTITITDASVLQNDATLSELEVSSGGLSPEFGKGITTFTASVANETSSVTITPTANESHAIVTVNGTTVASGQASGAISLNVGSNTITVVVTAEDGTTTKTYTIDVTRAAQEYMLSYSAGANGAILGNLSQTVTAGGNGTTVIAVANAGYHFVNWSDGATSLARTDNNVNGNISVTATFAENQSSEEEETPTPPSKPDTNGKTEVITVDVTNGNGNNAISKTVIERTTNVDGNVTDNVEYKQASAQETVDQLKKSGGDTARIVIPDKEDKVSEVEVTISKATLSIIAGSNVNLEIDTENARISLPSESIQNLEENLFFRVVPIKEEEKQQEVKERAKQEEVVKQVAGDSNISIVGRPMTIETNMSKREVDIVLPLRDIAIPEDPKEREAFLNRLGVFIEHSDGEKVLARAELVEFKDGVLGLKFRISKFSTFTIVEFTENIPTFDGETLVIEQKINLNQGWTIEFSNDADQEAVTQSSIYITDSKGTIHKTKLTSSENVVNVELMENYKADETYYLCVTKAIKSRTGKVLIKSVRYKFNTIQLSK
jgi:hypothetical protein